jgi:histidine triad (HIT) family protein
MEECVFCKIISGEIPSEKIYEDNDFMAFLDVNPRSEGHSLIIPKQHVITLADMPSDKIDGLFKTVQLISKISVSKLGAKGFTIGSNNGIASGQVVPHLHVHVIPRYDEGSGKNYGFEAAFPVKEELKGKIKGTALKMKTNEKIETAKEEPAKEEKEGKREWRFLKNLPEKQKFIEDED